MDSAGQRGIERYKYGNFMLLRCTQKFLTELRYKKSEIIEPSAALHPLDEWYAHIFYLYPRRKCAIFMHARTKFCFFAYDRNIGLTFADRSIYFWYIPNGRKT